VGVSTPLARTSKRARHPTPIPDEEKTIMAEDDSVPTNNDPFGSLATQIEDRPHPATEQGPQTASSRHIYWLIGGLCALTVGVAEVGILMRSDASSDAPAPPPAVVQRLQSDTCATRMTVIMDGVIAYKAKTGAAPTSLTALYPNYIPFEPTDPAVNKPYGYEVLGESVTLTCPSAAMGVASGAGASAPGV
jgi:hypothetical protein